MYAYWVELAHGNPIAQEHFLDKMAYAPPAFAILMAMSTYADFKALKVGWMAGRERSLARKKAIASVNTIRRLLKELKNTPEAEVTLASMHYYGSSQAESDLQSSVADMAVEYANEMKFLRSQGNWGQVEAFARSQKFFDLVNELRISLTESEKQLLNIQFQKRGLNPPLAVSPKILLCEGKIRAEFSKWMGGGGKERDMRSTMLRRNEEATDEVIEITHLSHGAEWSVLGASIGLTIAGIEAGIGSEPTAMDHLFGPQVVDLLRENSHAMYLIVKVSVLGPLFYQAAEFTRRFKMVRAMAKGAVELNMDALMRLLNISKPVQVLDQPTELTSEQVLEGFELAPELKKKNIENCKALLLGN